MVRGKEKASGGQRKDPAWKYSVQVDAGGPDKPYLYLKCNFCEKTVKGGVSRMKEHLSCTHKNVAPCAKVPEEVRDEISAYMKKATTVRDLSQKQFEDRVASGSYFESGKGSSSTVHTDRGTRGPMDRYVGGVDQSGGREQSQSQIISKESAKEAQRRVCMDIGRFFYENAIPFNVATSPSYVNLIRSVGAYGRGFKAPSMYDLRTWILKEELSTTDKMVANIKKTWIQTGVTVMSDGWSDMKNMSIINILVNNPYGTVFLRSVDASDQVKSAEYLFGLLDGVIEEIGEGLVAQVITDNASAYKAAGALLMEKRRHLYWTPCAAHCIDLILEDLGELPQHKSALTKAKKICRYIYNHAWVLALLRKFTKGAELLRPAATRFATAYLTLQSLLESRQPLESLFTSSEWLRSTWAKKDEGKEVRKTILSGGFWSGLIYALKTTKPLVTVLRLVDSERKPAMGFIYNAMDEAKELIAANLGGEESSYREI